MKSEIIYGRNPVREALRAGRPVKEIRLAEGGAAIIDEIISLAGDRGAPVRKVKREELDDLSGGGVHQGVVALVGDYRYKDLPFLIAKVKNKESSLILLLDGITDPQNLGSLLRTAECGGADGVIIPKARTAPVTASVAKASAGASEHIDVIQANLSDAAGRLKRAGYWLIGADASAPDDLWSLDWPSKAALVLGSEGAGISRLLKKECDYLVSIPMAGKISSLNVANSGSILIFEFRRRAGMI